MTSSWITYQYYTNLYLDLDVMWLQLSIHLWRHRIQQNIAKSNRKVFNLPMHFYILAALTSNKYYLSRQFLHNMLMFQSMKLWLKIRMNQLNCQATSLFYSHSRIYEQEFLLNYPRQFGALHGEFGNITQLIQFNAHFLRFGTWCCSESIAYHVFICGSSAVGLIARSILVTSAPQPTPLGNSPEPLEP